MEPGQYYHVYNHANGNENFFRTTANYSYFLKRYAHFINPIADTYAYCLLPNHFHFLVRIKTEPELEGIISLKHAEAPEKILHWSQNFELFVIKEFSHLFNAYTQAYNKMFQRKGCLFIHSFKRNEITTDHYLTNTICYIHANPIHHGFTKDFGHWAWNSYQAILQDQPTSLRRDEVLQWFGNRNEFLKMHQEHLRTKLTPL